MTKAASTLTPSFLVQAYAEGYFPMPDPETGKILWFRPDPRAIIPLEKFHVSRSLQRKIAKEEFQITYDRAFGEVMKGCAERKETWITKEFHQAYTKLHKLNVGHSVEVWDRKTEDLVGGVYGIALNGAFFAESKFHRKTDASKIALYFLVEKLKAQGFSLLEVQFLTPHLKSLGAMEISDEAYRKRLEKALSLPVSFSRELIKDI